MKKRIITCISILTFGISTAQIFEPFTLRYQFTPPANTSGTDFQGFDNTKRNNQNVIEAQFRYPIIFGKRSAIIFPEISHKTIGQNFNNWSNVIAEPQTGNLTRLFIKGVFPVDKKWNILGVAAISQGVDSGVNWDFGNSYYRFGAGFLINNKKGNQIGASIQYIEEIGFIAPAFVFIGSTGGGKWNYNVTFPLLSIAEYNLNKKWRLRLEERFDNDRFVLNSDTGANYNQLMLNLSVGISYQIAKLVFLNLQTGLTPLNVLTFYENRTKDIDTVSFGVRPTFGASLYVSVNPRDYIDK